MSFIAEYDPNLTQSSEALQAVPEMTVQNDETYFSPVF